MPHQIAELLARRPCCNCVASLLIDSPLMFAFASAAFMAKRGFKLDIGWVFGGGLALWALLQALGWAG